MLENTDLPTPIDRVDLRDAVTEQLRELILAGRFEPGQRLVETEVATRFGTSRGPVRDAFAALERDGLVETVPRSGTFVARLTAEDIDELYSLRLALEELAVRRAADRVTPRQLAEMGQALDVLSTAMDAGDVRAVAAADMRFHRTIVEAAAHRRLRAAWESVADQTLLVMRQLPLVKPEVQSDVGQHREVLEALAAGDISRAVAAMRSHLSAASDAMMSRRPSAG